MSSKKKKTVNYVDDTKLYTAMLQYKKAVEDAEANHKPKPRVPEYVGECIMKIAENFSLRQQFVHYPFREDMVGDAQEICIRYIDNFDPYRYKKPFAYFTQIVYFAFLSRINKEKKHLYTKHKALHSAYLQGLLEDHQFEDGYGGDTKIDLDNEYMSNLVDSFESKLANKKKAKKTVEDEDSYSD